MDNLNCGGFTELNENEAVSVNGGGVITTTVIGVLGGVFFDITGGIKKVFPIFRGIVNGVDSIMSSLLGKVLSITARLPI
ncbi:MAG: class IIb bacteriocin, lactobin A/cerein 7B family [Clostridiales bacterium]|jgi:lactobin A/cerein 7B family class IIb bacteriocin|nr:class IIb bacteriocin, lactobin A/cerein 7B family [Clostridiales bacterium]